MLNMAICLKTVKALLNVAKYGLANEKMMHNSIKPIKVPNFFKKFPNPKFLAKLILLIITSYRDNVVNAMTKYIDIYIKPYF